MFLRVFMIKQCDITTKTGNRWQDRCQGLSKWSTFSDKMAKLPYYFYSAKGWVSKYGLAKGKNGALFSGVFVSHSSFSCFNIIFKPESTYFFSWNAALCVSWIHNIISLHLVHSLATQAFMKVW